MVPGMGPIVPIGGGLRLAVDSGIHLALIRRRSGT
jgi:hypothetical protein